VAKEKEKLVPISEEPKVKIVATKMKTPGGSQRIYLLVDEKG